MHDALEVLQSLFNRPFSELLVRTNPYGFLVFQHPTRMDVRLHHWPLGGLPRQDPDWPPHSHPWRLDSAVLEGTLQTTLFEVAPESNTAMQLYSVSYEDGVSVLSATERTVRCSPISDWISTTGTSYWIGAGCFHEARPASEFVTTLVWVGDTEAEPEVVGSASEGGPRYEFSRSLSTLRIDPEKTLHEILHRLAP